MPFHDRRDAGRRLAAALLTYKDQAPIVLALPRGGVPVAAEVARALEAPLDLVFVRKIGIPLHPELAMGAVVDGADPLIVRNEDVIDAAGVSETDFMSICQRELSEIQRRRRRYIGERPHPDLRDRVVIVVDDGIATGATTRAGLRSARNQKPKMLILAVPVAPPEALKDLRGEADLILCLETYEAFGAVGFYYSDFRQVSDAEVQDILAEFQTAGSPEAAKLVG